MLIRMPVHFLFLVTLNDLDPKMQRLLTVYPIRRAVKWRWRGDIVAITYDKEFGRFERWLHKRIGGPTEIKVPLDEVGTKIWLMCDGSHTIKDICDEMDAAYKEDIEPVLTRVWGFLERLLNRNLIRLETEPLRKKDEGTKKK